MTAAFPELLNLSKAEAEAALTEMLRLHRLDIARALAAGRPDIVKSEKDTLMALSDQVQRSGMSQHAKDDAMEAVRRAEFFLGKAVRQGQAEGKVCVQSDPNPVGKWSISTFFRHRNEITEIYAMADGVSMGEFDDGLARARAEHSLSRANVVRQVSKTKPASIDGFHNRSALRTEKANKIRELAGKGWSRRAISRELSIAPRTVGQIAIDYGIRFDGPAGGKRITDSPRIVRETVNTLEGTLMALSMVRFEDLDPGEAEAWSESLTTSLRTLSRFHRKIKERLNQNDN